MGEHGQYGPLVVRAGAFRLLLAGVVLGALAPDARAQTPCAAALVLAMDVSRSVSEQDYALQVGGLASAFRDPEVALAIREQSGGVYATVMVWGDAGQQAQTTPWTHLTGGPETAAFAESIAATPRIFGLTLTGLGAAMRFANGLLAETPAPCLREVIDISGDGVSNDGPSPGAIWPAMRRGVSVNGLVILGATPDPYPHYRDEVIGGPRAFVETASDFHDYARAIRQKLLRELSPAISQKTGAGAPG